MNKLKLNKETLIRLESSDLNAVQAGENRSTNPCAISDAICDKTTKVSIDWCKKTIELTTKISKQRCTKP